MKDRLWIKIASIVVLSVMMAACTEENIVEEKKPVVDQQTEVEKVKETEINEEEIFEKDEVVEEIAEEETKEEVTKEEKINDKNDSKESFYQNHDYKKVEVEFIRIVDGDTIKIKYKGNEESIRLLLIDTPETSHPKMGVQPFGPEAKEYARTFFGSGEKVYLEFDVAGENRDKYGRLLAYAWVGNKMYNYEVIKEGLARVAYVYAPNTRHVDAFYEAQKEAQAKALNIWSVEDYATNSGFKTEKIQSEEPKEEEITTSTNNGDCDIKGNISSSGEKIYHVPSGQFYERTNEEEMFCSTQEAENAGYRASLR